MPAIVVRIRPAGAFAGFGASDDEFTRWFVEQVRDAHDVDLRQPPPGPLPELIADSGSVEEDIKVVVRRFFDEILGKKDLSAVDEILHDDYKNYFPGAPAPLDKQSIEGPLQEFSPALSSLRTGSASPTMRQAGRLPGVRPTCS